MKKNLLVNGLIAGFGAFICISLLAYFNFSDTTNLWLIPPFGASMVLVMSAHTSPLAQPKNIFFGHTLSALSGVLVYLILGANPLTIGLAVGLAIFVMITTNTIHLPAGGNPIIAVMGAKSFGFILFPVIAGALIIIAFSLLYNKALKRDYPTK